MGAGAARRRFPATNIEIIRLDRIDPRSRIETRVLDVPGLNKPENDVASIVERIELAASA
jgi:hypothetical protein